MGRAIREKKRKIIIHSIAFSPDGVSTAYLYNDIALGFVKNGYDVVVLTTTPHYNVVPTEIAKQKLTRCWGGLFYKSQFHEVVVYHVPQKKYKKAIFRIAGFVYWHFLSLLIGLFQRNISLVISPSPPLTLGFVSIILAKLKKAKVIYNVQEIYPDFLINQGNLKSGFTVNTLRKLESFVYNHSDKVITIDDIFYQTIVGRFKDPTKLLIIPNFVDTDIYKPVITHKLDPVLFPDKPVLKVMYAGNIGLAQDWQPLFEVAIELAGLPVEFFVIGEGVLKDSLKREIQKRELNNIHLLPYQPRETMAAVVSYADIHFIFMDPQMEGQGFPSKVYTIMACKKSLLIVSGERSSLYHFLKDKDCAYLVVEEDFAKKCREIENILRSMLTDKKQADSFGEKGYEVIQQQYSKKIVIQQYLSVCKELVE